MKKIKSIHDVAAYRLCLGCGTCFSACPQGQLKLIDVEDDGIRPFIDGDGCSSCGFCLQVCPGIFTPMVNSSSKSGNHDFQSTKRWGTFAELWEGYSGDPEIRFNGSSGGLCTALSLFCLEQGIVGGVLHIGEDPDIPWKNNVVRSTTREELVARTGSRYAPAAPGAGLKFIEDASTSSVFVGKPCDIEGLRLIQALQPALARKAALAIGFFCAGTPSTRGTLDFFRKYKIDSKQVAEFRYRGMGWPGLAIAKFKDVQKLPSRATYEESWGFLQQYRPFRCFLCPDLTAEFADISVGDPWYRDIRSNEDGRSLVIIRSEYGRKVFHQAMDMGYVKAKPIDPEMIYHAQKNLLGKRQAIWGRILAMKLFGLPCPDLRGFHLFKNWLDLSLKEKAKSIMGTAKRIILRNYFKRLEFEFKDGSWQKKGQNHKSILNKIY